MPDGRFDADRVVALPELEGQRDRRAAQRRARLHPHRRRSAASPASTGVYAAGDTTAFPVKQGGLAAQQADAVAQSIAAAAGGDMTPHPFQPVLQGLLLTERPRPVPALRAGGGHGETAIVSGDALWWPPAKIVGRYLAPFLAGRSEIELAPPEASRRSGRDLGLQLFRTDFRRGPRPGPALCVHASVTKGERPMQRIAVIANLKPDRPRRPASWSSTARRSIPDELGFARHHVYVSEGRAVFVFEGGNVNALVKRMAEAGGGHQAFAAWEPLLQGLPELAHEAYFWERAVPGGLRRVGRIDRHRSQR